LKDCHGAIDFQTDVVYDLDIGPILHAWARCKVEDITTYRDRPFTSKYTGTKSLVHHTPFMKAMDDSMPTMECFMKDPSKNGV
jgi:trimethylamine monooxygenase